MARGFSLLLALSLSFPPTATASVGDLGTTGKNSTVPCSQQQDQAGDAQLRQAQAWKTLGNLLVLASVGMGVVAIVHRSWGWGIAAFATFLAAEKTFEHGASREWEYGFLRAQSRRAGASRSIDDWGGQSKP